MQIPPLTSGCLTSPVRRAAPTPPLDALASSVEALPAKPSFPLPPTLEYRLNDQHPTALLAASGAPAAAAALALVQPEVGRDYTVHTTWKGQPYEIPVRFGSLLSRWCARKGNRIDLDTLELVKADGTRRPYLGTEVAERYRAETGRPAHPWLQFDPSLQVYGLPSRPVTLELRPDGTLTCSTQGIVNVDFEYCRERPYVERPPSPEELAPMPAAPWMGQPLKLAGEAFAYGRTPELRARCAEVFEEVCGKAAASGTLRGQPLHIFPVPDDKHWTAMPTVHQLQDQLLAMGGAAHGKANFLTTKHAVLIFVPESDLAGPGYGLRHELYHALEHKYLTDEQRAEVDACHAELVRKGGPFQSVYGYQRHEFLTTMAEEFEGEHGAEGRAWLRDEHPRLEGLLGEVTGR